MASRRRPVAARTRPTTGSAEEPTSKTFHVPKPLTGTSRPEAPNRRRSISPRRGGRLPIQDGTGHGADDAVHVLDGPKHPLAQLVDAVGLSPHDDVVGTGDQVHPAHAVEVADGPADVGPPSDLVLDQHEGFQHGLTSRMA